MPTTLPRSVLTLCLSAALLGGGALSASAAPPGEGGGGKGGEICGTFERAPDTTGDFQINNNAWGDTPRQCITPLPGGFEITDSQANLEFGGAPASYPSIIDGEHYGDGNDSKTLPVKVSDVPENLRTSATLDTGADGAYNAAWDIWVNTSPDSPDENDDLELMLWPNQKGGPTPIGTKTETVTVEGRAYDVWVGKGPGGTDVVSYVDVETTDTPNVPLKPFLDDATERGAVSADSYVTSVQLGFEPWKGGQGLKVENFRLGTGDAPAAVPATDEQGQPEQEQKEREVRTTPAPAVSEKQPADGKLLKPWSATDGDSVSTVLFLDANGKVTTFTTPLDEQQFRERIAAALGG